MDRAFVHPLRLSDGQTVVTITSAQEAGAFLLQHWPTKRRRRMAYIEAVRACVRAIAGKIEPEVARQALIEALTDLKSSPVQRRARTVAGEPDRLHRRGIVP